MDSLQVTYAGQPQVVPYGSSCAPWASPEVAAVLVNGVLASVHQPLGADAEVVPVTLATRLGHRVYRRTLAFLLEVARREVGLPTLRLGPSWGGAHGYSLDPGDDLGPSDVKRLQDALEALVRGDHALVPTQVPWAKALAHLDHPDDEPIRRLLAQKNPAEAPFVAWGGRLTWEPEVLMPSTGRLTVGGVEAAGGGIVLTFPQKAWPLKPARWKPSGAVARAHADDRAWGRIQGVTTVADLNELAAHPPRLEAFVHGAEALHERRVAALADGVAARGARIVLVAGPSSSGKTTFAKRLAVQLEAIGFRPLAVSLDDYFVNREDTPKDAEGRYDFESLGAMDRPRLAADLGGLLAGEKVELPVFDFKTGLRRPQGRPFQLGAEGVLILEGIHGLNRDLWPDRPAAVSSIFVSALTSLSRDGRSRISTADHRLIRRIVRDRQFRGYSALQTLRQWGSVRRGEDANLFPHQDLADGVFNSALPYEFAVLREAALPLLEAVPPSEPEYAQSRFLADFLSSFVPIPVRLVPPFSLLREFLGQSGFHY